MLLRLLFDVGLNRITLLGVGPTIVVDILVPRRWRTSWNKPKS
jgi:hypothetical protein